MFEDPFEDELLGGAEEEAGRQDWGSFSLGGARKGGPAG